MLDAQVNKWDSHIHLKPQVWFRCRKTRAGLPATTAPAGTSFVTTLPAPTVAASPMVTPQRIVAPEPIEAPRLTVVGTHFQSASVCRAPVTLVARGKRSLMNVTLWPTKTSSSKVTPSQRKE